MKAQRIVEDIVFHTVILLLARVGAEGKRRHFITQELQKLTAKLGRNTGESFIRTVDKRQLDRWAADLANTIISRSTLDANSDDADIILAIGACIPRLFDDLEMRSKHESARSLTS